MSDTLLLDRTTWDLVLDAQGDIALASAPYSILQDASSCCRLWLGEAWYNTALGVPYQTQILGQAPSALFVKTQMQGASLRVSGVQSATVYLDGITGRALTGQVQVTLTSGEVLTAAVT